MGRAGRRWSREWQRVQTDFTETRAEMERQKLDKIDEAEDGDVTPEQRMELARLMRMVDDASELQDKLVAEVLVSVPDDWLVLGRAGMQC